MVRCPKLFKWISKASDVAIGRRKRQDENDFGTQCNKYKNGEVPIIINKENKTVSTGEHDGLDSKEFHRMSKKKYCSLPVPSLRKSQVMDENQRMFVVDKRRFGMVVDPFVPGHNRSHTIDSTRTYNSFFGFDGQQVQPDKTFKKDFNMHNNGSKVKLDLIDESNEESPATILVAKKEILTRHGHFSVQSARLVRGGSVQGFGQVIKKDGNQLELRKNATHFSVTQVKLQAKNVLRFSSLITESATKEYFNEIKPLIFYLNYLDQMSITEPEKTTNKENVIKLNPEPGTCPSCKRKIACFGYSAHWCQTCESRRFENMFGTWTSGNDDIDCFILETQLDASSCLDYLEWIPYDRLYDIQYVCSGRFGNVFHSIWLDGPCDKWDNRMKQFVRDGECLVALKSFDNLHNISYDSFDKLHQHLRCGNNNGTHIIRCYGLTQDPITKNYILVMQYARNGDLTKYLTNNYPSITWERRLEILYGVATGLSQIHEKNLVHSNLHSGNILINAYMTLIGDLGICSLDKEEFLEGTYRVLPYIAPEILQNEQCTTAVDVYSFGSIMWELATNQKPFSERSYDISLLKDICHGLRPEITENIPECFSKLMQKCWNHDPSDRPPANELCEIIGEWLVEISDGFSSEITEEFQMAEKKRIEITNRKQFNKLEQKENINRYIKSDLLQNRTISFAKNYNSKEHFAVCEYIAAETALYSLKSVAIRADNTEIAAEVYDILQYW